MCGQVAEAASILAAGFDYVEVAASGFNGLSEDWDPTPYEGLPILATNVFFDSKIRLFGPEATPYLDYARRTVERAASLGVSLMVIGSGAARRAIGTSGGNEAFADIAGQIGEVARGFGIEIAPESLNRTETNVGNDLRSLALSLRERGVGYTADSYHVLYEWDVDGRGADLASLWLDQVPFVPNHVHIADLSRLGVTFDDPMLISFASRLRALGYDGNVSLECRREPDFDLAGSRAALGQLFG